LAQLDESIAALNQRFIFPRPFAMKIIKINLWNQGRVLGIFILIVNITLPSADELVVCQNKILMYELVN
jgi:hypothetical protein